MFDECFEAIGVFRFDENLMIQDGGKVGKVGHHLRVEIKKPKKYFCFKVLLNQSVVIIVAGSRNLRDFQVEILILEQDFILSLNRGAAERFGQLVINAQLFKSSPNFSEVF